MSPPDDETPEETLARLVRLDHMEFSEDGTGRCGGGPQGCFQLFAPTTGIAPTGEPAVDAALEALRDALQTAWEDGRAAVRTAAGSAWPDEAWDVEWTFDGDGFRLVCTVPGAP